MHFTSHGTSFDAFMFKAPLPAAAYASMQDGFQSLRHRDSNGAHVVGQHDSEATLYMNMLGAENFVAQLLIRGNLTLASPCQFVSAEHWDCSGVKSHRLSKNGQRESWLHTGSVDIVGVRRCREMRACHLVNPKAAQPPCGA